MIFLLYILIEKQSTLLMFSARSTEASWHADYRDTAYIYIGGLPFDLSEGDVITIFSQFGEPVYVNLIRDKETGKSKGFAFLKYEDQRSTDIAVDNLGGASVLGRVLKVDHTRYKRKDEEDEAEANNDNFNGGNISGEEKAVEKRATDRRRASGTESEEDLRPMLKEERELAALIREHDEDDPMKEYLIQEKKEVEQALAKLKQGSQKGKKDRHKRNHHHDHHRRHHSQREPGIELEGKSRGRRHKERRPRSHSPHRSGQ